VRAGGVGRSGQLAAAVGLIAVVALTGGWSGRTHHRLGGGLAAAIQKLQVAPTGRATTTEVLAASDGTSITTFELSSSFDNVHKHFAASGTQGPNRSPFGGDVDTSHGIVVYLRGALAGWPNIRALLPAQLRQRPWLRFDLSRLTKPRPLLPVRVLNDLLNLVPAARPYGWLAPLGRPVEPGGTEKLDGVETTRYRETVDFSPEENRLPNYLQSVVRTNGGRMTADVWVDRDSALRRLRLTSRPADLNGGKIRAIITIEFSGLGSKLTVALPATDQAADVALYASKK
jgi:hypothetical protein